MKDSSFIIIQSIYMLIVNISGIVVIVFGIIGNDILMGLLGVALLILTELSYLSIKAFRIQNMLGHLKPSFKQKRSKPTKGRKGQ